MRLVGRVVTKNTGQAGHGFDRQRVEKGCVADQFRGELGEQKVKKKTVECRTLPKLKRLSSKSRASRFRFVLTPGRRIVGITWRNISPFKGSFGDHLKNGVVLCELSVLGVLDRVLFFLIITKQVVEQTQAWRGESLQGTDGFQADGEYCGLH